VVQELDPEGKDDALRKMVVIGHSQGGLLTKLTAIDSGDRFWDRVFKVPIDRSTSHPIRASCSGAASTTNLCLSSPSRLHLHAAPRSPFI